MLPLPPLITDESNTSFSSQNKTNLETLSTSPVLQPLHAMENWEVTSAYMNTIRRSTQNKWSFRCQHEHFEPWNSVNSLYLKCRVKQTTKSPNHPSRKFMVVKEVGDWEKFSQFLWVIVVVGGWLDQLILEGFSNPNASGILWKWNVQWQRNSEI